MVLLQMNLVVQLRKTDLARYWQIRRERRRNGSPLSGSLAARLRAASHCAVNKIYRKKVTLTNDQRLIIKD